MPNLEESPNQWDREQKQCKAIIETPKGSRNKFKYNGEYETFALASILPEGLMFPYDFGFIPRTQAPDGDPLDVMILLDAPAHVGCLVEIRLIGVIEAEQQEDQKRIANHRLIAVAVNAYSRQDLHSIEEVSPAVLDQVEEFFRSYNRSRGKVFEAKGRHGPERAADVLERAMQAFAKKTGARD
jgi:inorganic pyrophosphatase